MTVTPLFTAPWGILANKKEAKLAGGAIVRGAQIAPANRSAYAGGSAVANLGMGYVEAVLAILHGIVGTIAFDPGAARGRVSMRSTGGPTAYEFSWSVEPGRVVFGGFGHSDGQPTYQAAIVGLAQLVALHRCGATPQSNEAVEQWYALVTAMEAAYPRANLDAGWDKRTIEGACANTTIRAHIERVSDALYHAMRFHLPALVSGDSIPPLRERGLLITAPDVLSFGEGRAHKLPGSVLLQPDRRAIALEPPASSGTTAGESAESGRSDTTTTSPEGAAEPAPRARRRAKAAAAEPASPPASPAPAATPNPATSAPPPGAPVSPPAPLPGTEPAPRKVYGPHAARIKRALAASGGPLFLSGPTATGKTTLAIQAAEELGMGVEIVVFDPGMDAQELFGGYARRTAADTATAVSHVAAAEAPRASTAAIAPEIGRLPAWARGLAETMQTIQTDAAQKLVQVQEQLDELSHRNAETAADWEAVDGPLTRWARRAIRGEQVLLVLDELARGHESCVSAVMRVLNTFDRRAVEQQGLSVPAGADGSAQYHILDIWMTKERLVVPIDRVKIVATANLGDRYTGLDLGDPAFRRRWTGGWLHLGAYAPDTVGEILADKLKLPSTAALITRMKAVATQVEQFQRSEDKLIATLDLATLIAWGQTVMELAGAPGMSAARAFAEAAADVWVERICPLKGAELDPDVRSKLLQWVSANAPTALR